MVEDRDSNSEIETNQEASAGRETGVGLPILTTAVGATVGGIATSSAAIGVAGAGGVSGYATGVALTIGALECSAAAVGTLAVIAAGPIVGGVLGYVGYRVYRSRKRARSTGATAAGPGA